MHLYQGSLPDIIGRALPSSKTVSADRAVRKLIAVKSEEEESRVATACQIAARAFQGAPQVLRAGLTEVEAAAEMQLGFASALKDFDQVQRAEAFVYVMSGKNSFAAHGAFAHSTKKELESGDLVLAHCNSYADGFATDITRTFSLGVVDQQRREMYDAIFAARAAAFDKLMPGVRAADIDAAARHVLTDRGYGPRFLHSTGHGVGFGAISANALPRIHPKSTDMLEPGMVFNVEPAIYIEGYGGMRHCDMVAITETGFTLLTDFQTHVDDMLIAGDRSTAASQ
jgi:Xaa-Pro dipeptidase